MPALREPLLPTYSSNGRLGKIFLWRAQRANLDEGRSKISFRCPVQGPESADPNSGNWRGLMDAFLQKAFAHPAVPLLSSKSFGLAFCFAPLSPCSSLVLLKLNIHKIRTFPSIHRDLLVMILGRIRGALQRVPLLNPLLAPLNRDLIQRVYIPKGPPHPLPYVMEAASKCPGVDSSPCRFLGFSLHALMQNLRNIHLC